MLSKKKKLIALKKHQNFILIFFILLSKVTVNLKLDGKKLSVYDQY